MIHLILMRLLIKYVYRVSYKASNSGSSFGVYKAYKKSDLADSIKKARKYDDNILIETFIKGREFSVGVVKYDNQIVVLPITEIITSNDFFDYQAKYEGKSKKLLLQILKII